jgi:hypothetical protein
MIDVDTLSTSFSVLQYKNCLIDVTYSTNGRKENTLFDERIIPAAEFTTQDYRNFRWGSTTGDLLKEGEAPGKILRKCALSRTLYNVAAVPLIFLTGIGGVNNTAYTSLSLGLTFAAETLLFEPGESSRSFTTLGTDGFTVSLNLEYNPNGWNKYWRAETQGYESQYIAGGAEYKSYEPLDLSDVLF